MLRRLLLVIAVLGVLPIVAARAADPRVARLAGADRYATAVEVSKASFGPDVHAVVVASGDDFPDALAAAPVAAALGGPVLLTADTGVPDATAAEQRRLHPARVVVVGRAARAASTASLVEADGSPPEQVVGADRYETAALLSRLAFGPGVADVLVAAGTSFADALAGGAAGAALGAPVLLVTPGGLPPATADELRRLEPATITVLGGTAAVSADVEKRLEELAPTVRRWAGPDRFATAAAVAANAFGEARPTVVLASGTAFPDALSAGALGDPVLLVPPTCVPDVDRAQLDRLAPQRILVVGGTAAVGTDVESLSTCPTLATAKVTLTPITALRQPLALASRQGDGKLYVAEKGGTVRAVGSGAVDPTPVLDISGQVATGSEQGLLGLAFSPDGRFLYVNYTDTAGDTQVVEYAMNGDVAAPASRRAVLSVDQPFANHNGGNLVFGPDGRLWVGMGDGGSANDPQDNAQRPDSLLGKLLRIDPRGADPRPQVWALGLRNPWRFSFDRATGDVWIGDVGQAQREEVDFLPAGSPAGANFGWARLEGTLAVRGEAPQGAIGPLLEYPTGDPNCAVTGGYVYRGSRIPGLVGSYVYGDYCDGRVLALRQEGGRLAERRDLGATTTQLSSFGQDNEGELYVLSLAGTLYRLDPA